MYSRNDKGKALQRFLSHPAWAGISGIVAILALIWGFVTFVPQAAPVRAGISQMVSGTSAPTNTPLPTATPYPTPTAPLSASAGTLPENIVLKCNCSDPLVVTITSIKIEPQYNRMVWSLTLYNNSQNYTPCNFDTFSLQSSLDDQIFGATGNILNANCNPGAVTDDGIPPGPYSTTVTFSFIPYTKTPYSLTTHVEGNILGSSISFLPVQITF